MTRIALEMLLPLLLMMGWRENDARAVYNKYPPVYVSRGLAGAYGAFDVANGRILLETGMTANTTDHEFQHAWYQMRGLADKIKRDFLAAAVRTKNVCISITVAAQPNDWTHWPHYVIDCVKRDKDLLPPEIRNAYFVWVKGRTERTFIPIAMVRR